MAQPESSERAVFTGTHKSVKEIKHELLVGWPEGVARMRATLARIHAPRVRSVRRRARWADQGDTVDMTRLYAGHIETAFRACKRDSSASPPRIKIVVNISASWAITGDQMFFRGAAATALAEVLCAAGYAVEVYGVIGNFGAFTTPGMERRRLALAVQVKSAEEPLSLSTVCAMLAHTAAFRLVGFCTIVRVIDEAGEQCADDLGSVDDRLTIESAGIPHYANERAALVPHDLLSAEDANAWIARTVAELEGTAAA